MQWIRTHLTIVICSAVSLVSIVLIVLGIVLCDVSEVMGRDSSLVQSLSAGRLRPVNQRVIDHQRAILDNNIRQVDATFKKLAELGTHEPLHEGLFPQRADDAVPFKFQERFVKAQKQMLETLNARDQPTPEEIADEEAEMEAQRAREESMEKLGRFDDKEERKGGLRGTGDLRFSYRRPSRSGGRRDEDQQADMTPEELAAEIPQVRLSIRQARSIYCYANKDSFDQRLVVVEFERPPPIDEFWYAQMSLWIQQDVVQALAGLNNRIADGLKSRGEDPWVGNLPVKHLQRFIVGGYLPPQGGADDSAAHGRRRRSSGSAAGDMAFTQRSGTKDVDVIRFSLELLVEARMLPSVIDEICKAGFYTPLLVEYEAKPPTTSLWGYIYGSDPAIEVDLQFEGCFLRDKYDKWMPESVKVAIREGRAVGQGTSSPTEGKRRSGYRRQDGPPADLEEDFSEFLR